MKKYLITSLLLLLFSLTMFASEKIADFRFEKTGPLEEIIYLVDKDGNDDYGQYVYSTNTYFSHSTSTTNYYIREHFVNDETVPPFNGVLTTKDISNMAISYNNFKINRAIAIGNGIGSGIFLATSIPLIVSLAVLFNNYKTNVNPKADFWDFQIATDYTPLVFATYICSALAVITTIAFIIFLAISIYHNSQFKAAKARLLKKLNTGIIIEDKDDNDLFSLAFDLRLGS